MDTQQKPVAMATASPIEPSTELQQIIERLDVRIEQQGSIGNRLHRLLVKLYGDKEIEVPKFEEREEHLVGTIKRKIDHLQCEQYCILQMIERLEQVI